MATVAERKETRTTLREVPSGKIEVVFNGVFMTLQFNAACTDVLDVCHAMCCRLRTNYTVILRPEEIAKFQNKPMPHSPHFRILQDRPDGSCFYLGEDELCTVHADKPASCTMFHCSPGGVGEGIQYRDGGWFLSPHKLHQEIDDKGTVVDFHKMYADAKGKKDFEDVT